jgi:hypothetical protein
MAYDSPTQIRRRQNAADNRAGKRTRKASPIKILTESEWSAKCDEHISAINNPISTDNAAARARALVHMAIERRASEIQRDLHRARWKAVAMARIELLGSETPSSEGCGDDTANGAGSFGKQTVTRISDALIASGELIPMDRVRYRDLPVEVRQRGLRVLLKAVARIEAERAAS